MSIAFRSLLLILSLYSSIAWAPILPSFGEVCARLGKAALSLFVDQELKYQTDATMPKEQRHALWTSEPGFQNRLIRATEKRLRESAEVWKDHPISKETTIRMNDKTFTILQVLGKGGDGEVFLVERNGVKSVLKRFTKKVFDQDLEVPAAKVLQDNLDSLAALRKAGVDTVEVRDIDKEASIVEFQYVEGVAVDSVIRYGLDHGFTFDDMGMVGQRFEEFKARHRSVRGVENFNIFLDPKTGKFIVIDPW